ncbi:hypothetical protein AB4Z48_16730 [Cupriavidus sp. 2TAF22]|uniref:hypothetical protein n=1 Tax=unclassified Cupriavidus TaxID=2640874 RepID=UPI003F8FE633
MSDLAAVIALGLFSAAGVQASEIACKTMLRSDFIRCEEDPLAAGQRCVSQEDLRPRGESLICDYAILNIEYERIYADQDRMLLAGAIQHEGVLAWRRNRDACTSVECLDDAFANWQQDVARTQPEQAVAQPGKPLAASLRRTPAVKSARSRPRLGNVSWVVTPTQDRTAPPQVIATTVSQPAVLAPIAVAPPVAQPHRVSVAPRQERTAGGWGSLGVLAWLGIFCGGLAYLWDRRLRHRFPGAPGIYGRGRRSIYRPRRRIPVPLLILSGLLVANGLVLIFILAR